MKKYLITLFAATALILTGCAGPSPVTPGATPTEPAPQSTELTFGDSYIYDDGIEISISEPEAYTPQSEPLEDLNGATFLELACTSTSGSDVAIGSVVCRLAVAAGEDAMVFFDAGDAAIGHPPDVVTESGQSVSFVEVWAVLDP